MIDEEKPTVTVAISSDELTRWYDELNRVEDGLRLLSLVDSPLKQAIISLIEIQQEILGLMCEELK